MKAVAFYRQILLLVILISSLPTLAQTDTRCSPWAAKLESLEGEASFLTKESEQWQSAQVGTIFCYGDTLRITQFRAALRLENNSLVRLKEGSTLKFLPPKKSYWVELLEGAAHFISRTPKNFTVKAPYMNAAVEGTEFLVSHSNTGDVIAVFEGRVAASNDQGSTRLNRMQQSRASANSAPSAGTAISLQNSVNWALHYPPIFYPEASLPNSIHQALKAGEYAKSLDLIKQNPAVAASLAGQNLQTAIALYRGRVNQAKEANRQALSLAPDSPDAQALNALMTLVEGKAETALKQTSQLVQSSSNNARVLLAHSYTLQAAFKLEDALESARQALALLPNEALLQLRVTELALSLDKHRLAKSTLAQFHSNNPWLSSQKDTLRAFLSLQGQHNRKAHQILRQAVHKDSSNALAQFALGLTDIRLGHLKAGRKHIELAAILAPSNSLYRSYLGKAYAEEGRSEKAFDQFTLAKALDPKDPTPWFYQGLEQQRNNQLVPALESIQVSQSLNDGRAVYRSRFLLDKDNASRSASLGRIYNTLGFEQQAIQAGASAVQDAPQEHSGHRLLAEVYANNNRFESLRASERLQATLLQPINAEPLPLGLAESGLLITEGAGPADLGLNEYNNLFVEEGFRAKATGLTGSRDTQAYDVGLGAYWEQFAFNLGHYRYKTDGFRENNDVDYEISNALVQWQPRHNVNLQAEVSRREEEQGDLALRFDLSNFSENLRENTEAYTYRLGANISFGNENQLLLSVIKKDKKIEFSDLTIISDPFFGDIIFSSEEEDSADINQYDLQYIFLLKNIKLVSGLNYASFESARTDLLNTFLPDLLRDEEYRDIYIYSFTTLFDQALLTIGYEYTRTTPTINIGLGSIDLPPEDRALPKLGLEWQANNYIKLRTAYAETYSRNPTVQTGLNPTHISGFAQLIDHAISTNTEFTAVGVDLTPIDTLSAGIALTERDIIQPRVSTVSDNKAKNLFDNPEQELYLNYAITDQVTFSLNYKREKYDRSINPTIVETLVPLQLENKAFHIRLNYQLSNFLSLNLTRNEVQQSFVTEGIADLFIPETKSSERFHTLDISFEYRFPKGTGTIELEAKNIFNQEFDYADFNVFTFLPRLQEFTPERSIFLKLYLNI